MAGLSSTQLEKKDLNESQTSNNSTLSKTEVSRLMRDFEDEKRKGKEKDELIAYLMSENEKLKVELGSKLDNTKLQELQHELSLMKAETEKQSSKIAELQDANDTVVRVKIVRGLFCGRISSFGLLQELFTEGQ